MSNHEPLIPSTSSDAPRTDGEMNDDDLEAVVGGGPGTQPPENAPSIVSSLLGTDDDSASLFI